MKTPVVDTFVLAAFPALLAALARPGAAFGCSCAPPQSASEAQGYADAVFVG